jgi:hypothetical protein
VNFSPSGSGLKWFCERARGQCRDKLAYGTQAERRKFELELPRERFIDKTDLAKFGVTFECRPSSDDLDVVWPRRQVGGRLPPPPLRYKTGNADSCRLPSFSCHKRPQQGAFAPFDVDCVVSLALAVEAEWRKHAIGVVQA